MAEQFINIEFPFRDDSKGKFLSLNQSGKSAIKSDLIHLLLTNRGERLYQPDFGANLKQYLFEPNDDITAEAIKLEIQESVKRFIPNLKITELLIERINNQEHVAKVRIDYLVTDDVFSATDFIELTI
jgi:phage baseplate assembly protein W